jgi:hypothetical protein
MYDINKADESVRPRVKMEQDIVKSVVRSALRAGYALSVYDGEHEYRRTQAEADVLKDMMETDEDYLYIWDSMSSPVRLGWVYFVYGNGGWDVISDYTVSLDSTDILTEANALSDEFETLG